MADTHRTPAKMHGTMPLILVMDQAVRRRRAVGRLRTGAALLCVEDVVVTLMATSAVPMVGFAADGGEQAATLAMILDGVAVLGGIVCIVVGVLAMRGDIRAAWVGVDLGLRFRVPQRH